MSAIVRRLAKPLTAVVVAAGLFQLARIPELPRGERVEIASQFHFAQLPLPEPSPRTPRYIRNVHPDVEHIRSWISAVGAAVALNDLDGDGLPNDVCYVDTRTDRTIVAPAPGTPDRYRPFLLDPAPVPYDPATMAPMGCLPADLNEDGLVDLVVYFWGRTPVVFLRHRDGAEHGPVALSADRYRPQAVVATDERWYTNAAATADIDGDGHPDLLLGNYFPDGSRLLDTRGLGHEQMQDSMSRAANGGRDRLLLWQRATAGPEPHVWFRDASSAIQGQASRGWTLGIGAADLDGDMLPELYVANDFGPDCLLHNRSTPGNPRLVELRGIKHFTTPGSKVLSEDAFKGMGVEFGDLNGDGFLDIYVSNIAAEYALEESHFAWVSTGEIDRMWEGVAPYDDRSEPLGLSRSSWGWDTRLEDLNNDGVLEALQATGFVRGTSNRWPELHELALTNDTLIHLPQSWFSLQPGDDLSGHRPNPFFVRAADGRYYDVATDIGLAEAHVTRGIATADVDGDGLVDFATANQWEPSFLYHNTSPAAGGFLGLHVLLPVGGAVVQAPHVRPGHPGPDTVGRAAIGAAGTVRLSDGRLLAAQVDGGNGHSGKRSFDLHFGLGHAERDAQVPVQLTYRDTAGQVRIASLHLTPGWHTVVLPNAD